MILLLYAIEYIIFFLTKNKVSFRKTKRKKYMFFYEKKD